MNRQTMWGLMMLLGVAMYLWKSGELKKHKSTRESGPNVVLITLNSTRADAVGVYGGKNETPVLDTLAKQGTMFTHAVSTSPLTQPAHVSILSGNPPYLTGVVTNGTDIGDRAAMLSYALGAGGWVTGAFVSAYPLTRQLGWGQGWDHFDDTLRAGLVDSSHERAAVHTVDKALEWMELHKKQHFGVWIHLFEPHGPYEAPGRRVDGPTDGPALDLPDYWPDNHKAITDSEWFVEAYKAEVRTVDAAVGRVMDALDEWGVLDETLIVVTADHGESLTEHDYLFDHGDHLYDVSLRVPLIFRWPGKINAGAALSCLVSNQDITPTLLGLLGIADEHERQGRDLSAVLSGAKPCVGQSVLATTTSANDDERLRMSHALRTHRYKRIVSAAVDGFCFDLESDPRENRRVSDCPSEMKDMMLRLLDDQVEPIQPRMDETSEEALRALGYAE